MKHLMSFLCISLGIFFLLCTAFLYWERTDSTRLAFSSYHTPTNNQKAKIIPLEITIPSQQIDLPVYPVTISHGVWPTITNGVSYIQTSAIPGNTGNSIIYGHNWQSLFGRIVYLKPSDTITIIFSNHTKKTFSVTTTNIVFPNQTQILNQTSDKRLTLYTCTGFLDIKRFVVIAEAINK